MKTAIFIKKIGPIIYHDGIVTPPYLHVYQNLVNNIRYINNFDFLHPVPRTLVTLTFPF